MGTLGTSRRDRYTWVGPCVDIVCCGVGMEVFGKFGVDNLWILHKCSVTSTVVCMSLAF